MCPHHNIPHFEVEQSFAPGLPRLDSEPILLNVRPLPHKLADCISSVRLRAAHVLPEEGRLSCQGFFPLTWLMSSCAGTHKNKAAN